MVKDYIKVSDKVLIEECSAGNIKAFNQLFERYFGLLYSFSLRYVKQGEIAEELVMDLMQNIWKKRTELNIKTEVKTYLFSAMKNVLFNHIRKKELVVVDLDILGDAFPASTSTADQNLAYKELEKIYQLKLAELSPQRMKIFKLSREADLTYLQIADQMNLSVNTVKSHMLFSLKFLRENIKESVYVIICLFLFFFH
ncbi:RNA polymerase sigma-70 factor [Pedobacter caeni]|uniref:RNA polymerase sigma-70 factor, ECF subfamily n=1 Tax=Pedobacter caeni TaxID=288992 RepID=A0A1M5BY01_9SPHI|nr:RNA polymerase sigma-70 factor [Pedobacter caeni]SHF47408.1 RNA polymerase sigma-70 factor, ECF subfamily [Pedobacter caeni]